MPITPRRGATIATSCAAAAVLAFAPTASANVPPEHAVVVCQTASFYANYDHAQSRPVGFLRTLTHGNKVGHTRGAHPVYNGWAASMDFGPNQWGYLRAECLGGWGSW